MGNIKQGVYPLQAKGNLGKHEIRNGNYDKSGIKSINYTTINQNNLIIYHQNIRGIINKTDELLLSFTSELPHVICLSEHHLKDFEINTISLNQYILASEYCRKNFKQGGVCIFIQKSVQFTKINNIVNCKEKDLELCAIQLNLLNICIVCIYRAPSGDFFLFPEKFRIFLK